MFLNVCKQTFYISRSHISKSKSCFNVKSSTCCFHMKTKILADFQICINVPLRSGECQCCDVTTNDALETSCGTETVQWVLRCTARKRRRWCKLFPLFVLLLSNALVLWAVQPLMCQKTIYVWARNNFSAKCFW